MKLNPIFIVGCGRSGTTLLFKTLSQNNQLVPTTGYPDGEDHVGWIEHGKCILSGIGNVNSKDYGSGINGGTQCLYMDENDINKKTILKMRKYYQSLLENKYDHRIINKQPHLSNKLKYVSKIFPQAKFIHIIRDCPSVVASWISIMEKHPNLIAYIQDDNKSCLSILNKANKNKLPDYISSEKLYHPENRITTWVNYWKTINTIIPKQMTKMKSQIITIRYEDLVMYPEQILSVINRFCELDNFKYSTEHFIKDTHTKHKNKLSAHETIEINRQSSSTRQYYSYIKSENNSYKNCYSLYLP